VVRHGSGVGGKVFGGMASSATSANLGGLAVPDLRIMGLSLRLSWLWLQRCDGSRHWSNLLVASDRTSKALFKASITCQVGNGENTLF
jgi:hypothetical protein